MKSVDIAGQKTLEDLRLEANLRKSDVYNGVGVSRRTYERWIEGKTLPDLAAGLALSKVLKVPFPNICKALNLDTEGILFTNSPSGSISEPSGSFDKELNSLVKALKNLPDEQAAAVVRLLFKKKDGESPLPS